MSHHHCRQQGNNSSTTWWVIGIVVVLLLGVGVLIALSPPSAQSQKAAVSDSTLTALELNYDFGSISMAKGKVTKVFTISNNTQTAITVSKLYSSCMCTSGTLVLGDRRVGPFSMEGMGPPIPTIAEELAAGQTAQVEVTFDPAAHGPAGVGPITRNVFVDTTDGKKLVFEFKAQVTP